MSADPRQMLDTPFLIGIDLGTTNSAVAFVRAVNRSGRVELFSVPQLVEPSLVESRPVLPSFLYFGEAHEIDGGQLALPWNPKPDAVAGVLARDRGALAPARQVASAKSWLAHPGIDRRAAILPWGAESGPHISPLDASTYYLAHMRDAWNAALAGDQPERRFERQRIVLAVPASFDEEARELTVEAARQAELEHLTLVEEPIAAFYAWATGAAAGSRSLESFPADSERVALVCDVGGGTTDFSLIRVRTEAGTPAFERIAVGDHLLLGGDNVDLALAAVIERRMIESHPDLRLAITQRSILRRLCSAAKERMLGDSPPEQVAITVLGAGRAVIGAAATADLTSRDVERTLDEFLPVTAAADGTAPRDRRAGLRELGLPYESDPAITRHLAGFLARSAEALRAAAAHADLPAVVARVDGRAMVRPDLVLFNGGFFTPAAARDRVVEALKHWFGEAPLVLAANNLEAAVAVGAATYARLRAGIGPAMSLVKAGSGRAYYIGLRTARRDEALPAVCVLARGTEEGTGTRLDHSFTVMTNRPIAFSLYSSIVRADRAGDLVSFSAADAIREHAPLVTVLRFGRKSRQAEIPVRLSITFTELGTLELWCESQVSDHRWRLQFQLRGHDEEQLETAAGAGEPAGGSGAGAGPAEAAEAIIHDEAIAAGERAIHAVFETGGGDITTENLVAHLEQVAGYGKAAWPLPVIRRFADVLIEVAAGRRRSPALEARWLNLFGFCFRPGFGAAKDPWRIGEARGIYTAGLAFPNAIQNRVEWLVLWQRVAGGFSAGQQRELAQRVMGDLGLLGRKPARLNPQIERESWRLLASLERLDTAARLKIGDELLARIRRDARNASLLWAVGRLGARAPLYGPLSSVVPPDHAARWLDALAAIKLTTPELAGAMVQIGARTGDRLRDVDGDVLARARRRLSESGIAGDALQHLDRVLPSSSAEMNRVFGEPLPDGLRLQT